MCPEEALLAQDRSKEAQDGRKMAPRFCKRSTFVTFWLHFGPVCAPLEAARSHLGPPWAHFGSILGLLGPILGLFGLILGLLGAPWGISRATMDPSWPLLRAISEPS